MSAIDNAAKPIAGEITEVLARRYKSLVACHVVVADLASRHQADLIQSQLEKSEGVSAVHLRVYDEGVARFLVECSPEAARKLSDYLLRMKDVDLDVHWRGWNSVLAGVSAESRGEEK